MMLVGQIWRHKLLGTYHAVTAVRDAGSWVNGRRTREYLVGNHWRTEDGVRRTMVPVDQWAGLR